jgi:hypothetical protein
MFLLNWGGNDTPKKFDVDYKGMIYMYNNKLKLNFLKLISFSKKMQF